MSVRANYITKAPTDLTKLYLPLALSWLMMSLEGPVSTGILSRMPDSKVQQAAFFALLSISLFIESPAIDFISTATTLMKGKRSYLSIRNFNLLLSSVSTVVHILFALTPLFDFVTQTILNLNPQITAAMHGPAICFIPWTAAVGWRRFHQGVIIRSGETKRIGQGTMLRLATMLLSGILLSHFGNLTGLMVVALCLNISVVVEATFATWACNSYLRKQAQIDNIEDQPLSMKQLMSFHLPMTASTMIAFAGMPLVASFLSRYPTDAVLNSAAWSVALTVSWPLRAMTFAIPEVIIKTIGDHTLPVLRNFTIKIGLICMAIGVGMGFTGLDMIIFTQVLNAKEEVARAAHVAILYMSIAPIATATSAYYRGLLTAAHETRARMFSIGVSVGALFLVLNLGLWLNWPAIETACYSNLLAFVAETGYLYLAWRKLSTSGSLTFDPAS
ncbi:MAG: hypothetical protein K8R88_04225 [Armatimonadetes bacterium]|nr:hypothetical protein [Armatimonadota bacterium]